MLIHSRNSQTIIVCPVTANRKAPRRAPFYRPIRAFPLLAACLSFALCPVAARSQTQPPLDPPGFSVPGRPPSADPALRRLTERMARTRNADRQKKIVADTNRLLNLARELNDAVSHSTKNTLSLDVVKKADEIEKLAKTIKEKMRDGE